jgi:hypothetical protein
MSELPPPFFSEPARALHVDAVDDDFTGPVRLAREAAAATVCRDDGAMADVLGRAWRSGAPDELLADELLADALCSYATAHELDLEEARAIASVARFVPAVPGAVANRRDVELLGAVAARVSDPLGRALATAQDDEEPCWCPSCIAEAAALN